MTDEVESTASDDPRSVLTVGHLYPLAEWEPNPFPAKRADVGFAWTGETRPPKAGEWYLSGAIIEAYRAEFTETRPYPIAVPVRPMSGPEVIALIRIAYNEATSHVQRAHMALIDAGLTAEAVAVELHGWACRAVALAELLKQIPGTPEAIEADMRQRERESKET